MRLRRLVETVSATALGLALLLAPATAQETTGELGIPLPEQPALVIVKRDAEPQRLDIPAPAEVTLDLRPSTDLQSAEAAEAKDMVTGALSTQPDRSLTEPELDLPEPEMPPVDPALTKPIEPVQPQLAKPAAPQIDLPPLPDVAVTLPAGLELSGRIAAQAEIAAALPRLSARERADIVAAYAANENRPFWIDGKDLSAAGKQIAARLGHAGEDGLRTGDYLLPVFEANDKDSLAAADIRLSALAVLYARDARGGRIDPRRLSKLITPKLELPSATEVLSELTGSADAGAVLAAYNPQHAGYQRLKAKLAELRIHKPETPVARIPAGPALKVGMRDARVPLVRARLGLGSSEEPVFDRSTALALADFQKQAGLRADGVLSDQTVAALAMPPSTRLESDIVAQMERWRWLPTDLGENRIVVNIPEYKMRVMHGEKLVHEARVIVGKPESATPVFSHKMDHVVVNPSWFVPPSILKKEFLPGLANDPNYGARRGYVVTRGKNGNISVRQPPGERNALGWIKFMFPNDHAVYLHDTPNRSLFGAGKRAFSHGCVRVENPFALADQVLGPEWTAERLKRLIGSGERTIKLPQPLAIHLVYETFVVNEAGAVSTFDDIYGFHRLVRNALEQRS
ncbi:L,D-transpeptidase family protein [Bosea vestrisii]|uniref:L,D-transpeptidase family protein n=1 Tax=Bosea vestrisii TaxID=151416 RepID=UPI0024E01253|nr:L,D-transpeptidase family protein [Bosea vestrisii]WID98314.1 L,D-transpeptidase family protein [Bosea vestrisii]